MMLTDWDRFTCEDDQIALAVRGSSCCRPRRTARAISLGGSMASKYRKIDPRIWYDEKFSQLNPTAKLVAVHLITSPEGNRIGLFPMSTAAAAEHCGLTPESFRKAFDIVREAFQWHYDTPSRVLFISTWWKYQRPDHKNAFIGCLKDLSDVPKCFLVQEFLANDRYLPQSLANCLRDQRESFAFDPPKLCLQEQEQEQEQDTPCSPPKGDVKAWACEDGKRRGADWWFENRFWPVVHLKTGKQAAWRAFQKALARKLSPLYLTQRMAAFSGTPRAKRRRAIHVATWLNQGCYEDDPQTWEIGDEEAPESEEETQKREASREYQKALEELAKRRGAATT